MKQIILALFVYCLLWPLSLRLAANNGKRYLVPKTRLPDMLHLFIQPGSPTLFANLLNVVCYVTTLSVVLGGYKAHWWPIFITYMSVLEMFRCVMFNVTLLPDASQYAHQKPGWKRVLTGGVHDLIPSGHILHFYSPLWFLYRQSVLTKMQYWGGVSIVAACMYHILRSRHHYTIDLIVAIAVAHWVHDIVV